MADEFTSNVAQKFPNSLNKDSIEKPWDVSEPKVISSIKRMVEEPKREEISDRIHTLIPLLNFSGQG